MQSNSDAVVQEEKIYAGFFVRLAAYLIDWLIVGTALLVFKIPMWVASFSGTESLLSRDFIFSYSAYDIVLYILKVLYFALCTYYTGATVGKHLLQLQVVSTENRKPTFFEIVYRESVGKFLSGVIMSLGYIIAAWDKKKQGLHDKLADTVVVYAHKKIVYVAAPAYEKRVPYVSTQAPVQEDAEFEKNFPSDSFQ